MKVKLKDIIAWSYIIGLWAILAYLIIRRSHEETIIK